MSVYVLSMMLTMMSLWLLSAFNRYVMKYIYLSKEVVSMSFGVCMGSQVISSDDCRCRKRVLLPISFHVSHVVGPGADTTFGLCTASRLGMYLNIRPFWTLFWTIIL